MTTTECVRGGRAYRVWGSKRVLVVEMERVWLRVKIGIEVKWGLEVNEYCIERNT